MVGNRNEWWLDSTSWRSRLLH